MKRFWAIVAYLCLICVQSTALAQDKLKTLGGIGDAMGYVVDAQTNQYIAGAHIQLLLPADVKPIKGSEADTIPQGEYTLKASLGTVSTRIAAERFIFLSPANLITGLFNGGFHKTERHINVSQLLLRVTKDGYKPFVGPVQVEQANLEKNHVWLFPIKLAPVGEMYLSYAPNTGDLGTIDEVKLSTLAPGSGETLSWSAHASLLPLQANEKPTMECELLPIRSHTSSHGKVIAEGTSFEGQFQIQHRWEPGVYKLRFSFAMPQCKHLVTYRYIAINPPANKKEQILQGIQQVNAILGLQAGKTREVVTLVRRISTEFPASASDEIALKATGQIRTGDYADALKTLERVSPTLRYAIPGAVCYALAEANKHPDNPEAQASARRMVDRAAQWKLTADTESEMQLFDACSKAEIPEVTYGSRTRQRQLSKTQQQISDGENAYIRQEYQTAYSNFRAAFAAKDSEKTNGFYPRLHYGMLLLEHDDKQKAEEMFVQAMMHARRRLEDYSRSPTSISLPGGPYTLFTAPQRSGTVGYAYPEASLVQLVLGSYEAFTNPDTDWLTTTVLGRALAELGCKTQALDILSKLAAKHPDEQFVLSSYAVALKIAGDNDRSQEITKQLLLLNPRNPEGLALVKPVMEEVAIEEE